MELDFSRQTDLVWALLPEIALSGWAMVVLLAGVVERVAASEAGPRRLGWLSLAGVALAAAANGWLHTVTEVGSTAMVAVDSFRLFANWVFLLSAALTILISLDYVARQRLPAGEFYALLLLSTVGMMFLVGSRDLILIFLGFEVMSVAVYVLSGLNRRDRRSAEAGLKYFLLGAFSTGFLLYGIALVYGATGTTNLALMAVDAAMGTTAAVLLLGGVALLAVGFGFKVAAVPFHVWVPDVYEGAPSPVTAFMATAVKAAAFAAFLRIFAVAFDGIYESWYAILWWIAVLTMVAGNLVALVQGNVKRMLAYSSIAHAGYLLVALVAANELGGAALLFYLLVYTLMNIGAFAVVIAVAHQGEARLEIEDYTGMGWQRPALAALLTVFLLSLAGFPGTGGFTGKLYILQAAVDAELWTLAVVLVLATLVSYWYYLRVAWYMWMREPATAEAHAGVFAGGPMRVTLAVAAAGLILLGVLPNPVLRWAGAGIAALAPGGVPAVGGIP